MIDSSVSIPNVNIIPWYGSGFSLFVSVVNCLLMCGMMNMIIVPMMLIVM